MHARGMIRGEGLFGGHGERLATRVLGLGLIAAILTAPATGQVTVDFQQGAPLTVEGTEYFGAIDGTMNYNSASFNTIGQYIDGVNNGNNDEKQYFIQFDQIFGDGPGLIPQGATILDAQLVLTTGTAANNQSNGRFVVAGMTVPFTTATSLADLGATSGALGSNGPTYANGNSTLPVGGYKGPQQGSVVSAFVAPVVQGWSDGSLTNNGLVVQAHTTDAWWNYGIADATVGFHPKLSVSYITGPTDTASLVSGVGGYAGMTMISMDGVSGATIDQTDAANFYVDGATGGTPPGDAGSPDVLALVKFDGIFGSGATQVPARAEIAKSWLVFTTNNGGNSQSAGPYSVYRMNDSWDTSSTYATYGNAGPVPGTDYVETPTATVEPMEKNQQAWFDVTTDVEAWFTGSAANNGFILRTDASTDGWEIGSGGNSDVNRRPDLRVTYTVDPLIWKGNLSGAWDAGSGINAGGTQNWQLASNSTPTNFIDTDRVVFDDTATGSGLVSVTISSPVSPQITTIDNSSRDFLFTGNGGIAGAGRLVKTSASTATLETENTFVGGTTVTGGILRVGNGGAAGSLTGSVAIEAGGTLEFNRSGSLAVAGVLSGDGALVKNGTGLVTLDGSHTFSGTVQVNAGSLALTPFDHAGGMTVANGAALVAISGVEPATLSTASLALGGTGSTLAFEMASSSNPTVPLLAVTQADGLALSGGNHSIAVSTSGALQPGRFTLLDYTGSSISSGFTLAALPPRVNASLEYDLINTSIDLNVIGTDTPRWAGSISAVWDAGSAVDVGGTFNWSVGSSATNFVAGDQVIFDDTASAGSVSLASPVSPGSVLVDTYSLDYTFAGPGSFEGAGVLTKSGSAGLTLLADHASSGGIAVLGGSLTIGDGSAAPTIAGPITIAGAGSLSVRQGSLVGGLTLNGGSAELLAGSITGGAAVNAGQLSIGAGGTGLALAGDVLVDAAGTLAFDIGDDLTYAESLSGSGAATKTGAGTLTLTGSSPFNGTLTIDGGTVVLADNGGGDLDASSVIVNNGGTFQFGFGTAGNPDLPDTTFITANDGGQVIWEEGENVGGINLAGGGLDLKLGGLTAIATTPSQWTAGTLTGTGPTAQLLGGTGAIEKTGSGIVTVTGNASIGVTGGLGISEGTIQHATAANLGTSDVLLGGDFTSGTFGYAGSTAVRGGTFTLNAGGGAVDVADEAATLSLNGTLAGSGSLTKTGPGILAIVGDNQASGSLVVDAGTLAVGPSAVPTDVMVANGATFAVLNGEFPAAFTTPMLQLGSTGSTLEFTLSGSGLPATPLMQVTTLNGLVTSGGSHILAVQSAQELVPGRFTLIDYEGGPISSDFSFVAPPRVAASLVYDTLNTTIDLDVTGVSQIRWTGSSSSIWDAGSAVDVGGTVNWADTISSQATNFVTNDRPRFDDSASSGAVELIGVLAPAQLTVDNSFLDYTFHGTGSLAGAADLTKTGTGRLTLALADSRTGRTTVTGGPLQIGTANAAGSLAGDVTIEFGAALDILNGSVAGDVSVNGSSLSITDGTLGGNLALTGGGQLTFNGSSAISYAGTISGDGTISNDGPGTFTAAGSSTGFTGAVVINAGTFVVDDLGAGGDLNAATITVNNTGTFVFGPNGNPDLPADTFITTNLGGRTELRIAENFGGVILDGGDLVFAGDFRSGINLTVQQDGGLDFRSGTVTTEFTNVANGGVLNRGGSTITFEKTTDGTVVLGPGVSIGAAIPVSVHEGTLAIDVAALQAANVGEYLLGDIGPATLRVDGSGTGTRASYTLIGSSGGTFDIANQAATLRVTGDLEAYGSLTKAGPGTLVLTRAAAIQDTTVSGGILRVEDPASLGSGPITVTRGSLEVAPGVVLQGSGVMVNGGMLSAGSLTVGGGGLTSVTVTSGGIGGRPAIDIVGGGTLILPSDSRTVVTAASLAVDDFGGLLDLGASMITFGPGGAVKDDLRADILAGRRNGWTGTTGITSSAAAATSGREVGYIVNPDGSGKVGDAAAGDIDLNGAVSVFDLVGINGSGTYGAGIPSDWSTGDFNFDGKTNVFDLVAINTAGVYGAGNYLPPASGGPGPSAISAVPEPGSLGLGGLAVAGAIALLRRRLSANRRAL